MTYGYNIQTVGDRLRPSVKIRIGFDDINVYGCP